MNAKRSFLKFSRFGILIFLIIFIQLFQNKVTAQNELRSAGEKLNLNKTEMGPSKILLADTLKVDKNQNGILKKIIQPIKYRDNRNNIEKEKIYHFMQNLITNGQLNIDPSKVDEIIKQLEIIISENNSTKMVQKGGIKSNDVANQATNDKIDAILSKYNILNSTNKELIDSVKIQMSNYIRVNERIKY